MRSRPRRLPRRRDRHRRRRCASFARPLLVAAILTNAFAACQSRSTPLPSPHAIRAVDAVGTRPSVEWAGCVGVRAGPICDVGSDRKLTVWIAEEFATDWDVVDDRKARLRIVERPISGGRQLEVEVPAATGRLALVDATGGMAWSLAVAPAKTHDDIDGLVARGRAGNYEAALSELEKLRATAPAARRGPADAAIGRMALALGDVGKAEAAFRSAIAAARIEGRVGDVVRDGAALLWALVMLQQRFADARTLLGQITALGESYPEGRVWIDYHAGLLAAHTGDVRTALERFRSAEHRGRRIGLAVLADNATMEIALLFTRLGRAKDASAALTTLRPPEERCARSSWAINLAWAAMQQWDLGADARDARAPDVWSALVSAERATESCPDPHRRLLALINSAEYALKIGDRAEITRLVAAINRLPIEHDVRLASWRADILGQRALLDGDARAALSRFEEEVRTARGAGLAEEEFRGEVGVGRALLRLGRRGAAIERLNAARRLVERMMHDIPVGEGRGGFLGGHDVGVRTLLDALIASGAAREALRVARETRAAELAQMTRIDRLSRLDPEARRRWDDAIGRYQRIRSEIERLAEQDWTLSSAALMQARAERRARADEARAALDQAYALLASRQPERGAIRLSEPSAGEVYLTFAPGARGWYAFAATTRAVTVRAVDARSFDSPMAAARTLLMFQDTLASARKARLFPYGAADRVDWHVVPWNGRPLGASIPVEYGLDVPTVDHERDVRDGREKQNGQTRKNDDVREAPAAAPIAARASPRALIVANPTGDLPAASSEGDVVARALARWQLTRLDGERVTRQALMAALPTVGLFHYAGHAQMTDEGGWSGALRLSGNSQLELGDLLAADSVPEVIILSACEAAATASSGPSLLGLGQVFVLAGARTVLAPGRAVGDAAAKAFVQAFYASLAKAGGEVLARASEDVTAAYRDAIRAASDGAPAGWESFRLLVP